jgi:hypothetical protein
MTTYTETVLRYQIQRHDELPEEHKAALRERGIDPDERWLLIYSFDKLEDAEIALTAEREDACSWETFRLVDAGEAQQIERFSWA